MKKLFFLAVLTTMAPALKAQDISSSSLAWNVSQLNDLNTNATTAYQCTFKTNGGDTITWVQKGNYTTSINVTATTGVWTDVSTIGKVVYSVSLEGEPGTITFERDA